jgi:hypothetical protein
MQPSLSRRHLHTSALLLHRARMQTAGAPAPAPELCSICQSLCRTFGTEQMYMSCIGTLAGCTANVAGFIRKDTGAELETDGAVHDSCGRACCLLRGGASAAARRQGLHCQCLHAQHDITDRQDMCRCSPIQAVLCQECLPLTMYADNSTTSPRSSRVSLMMVLQLLHSSTAGDPPAADIPSSQTTEIQDGSQKTIPVMCTFPVMCGVQNGMKAYVCLRSDTALNSCGS